MSVFLHDPQDRLDYTIDWAAWLDADTITTATWTVPGGIVADDESHTASSSTVWLSGGSDGGRYLVTCHIVTAAGREADRSLTLMVVNR